MKLTAELTPEKLSQLLKTKKRPTFRELGDMFGVSKQRIHQIYSTYKENYPELFKDIIITNPNPTKETFEKLVDKGLSYRDIAEECGVSVVRVKDLVSEYGIKKLTLKERIAKDMYLFQKNNLHRSDGMISTLYNIPIEVIKNTKAVLGLNDGVEEDELFEETEAFIVLLVRAMLKRLLKEGKSYEDVCHIYNCKDTTLSALRYECDVRSYRKGIMQVLTKDVYERLYSAGFTVNLIADTFKIHIQTAQKLKKIYKIQNRPRIKITSDIYNEEINNLIQMGVIKDESLLH